jgi:hypothetical protein
MSARLTDEQIAELRELYTLEAMSGDYCRMVTLTHQQKAQRVLVALDERTRLRERDAAQWVAAEEIVRMRAEVAREKARADAAHAAARTIDEARARAVVRAEGAEVEVARLQGERAKGDAMSKHPQIYALMDRIPIEMAEHAARVAADAAELAALRNLRRIVAVVVEQMPAGMGTPLFREMVAALSACPSPPQSAGGRDEEGTE